MVHVFPTLGELVTKVDLFPTLGKLVATVDLFPTQSELVTTADFIQDLNSLHSVNWSQRWTLFW